MDTDTDWGTENNKISESETFSLRSRFSVKRIIWALGDLEKELLCTWISASFLWRSFCHYLDRHTSSRVERREKLEEGGTTNEEMHFQRCCWCCFLLLLVFCWRANKKWHFVAFSWCTHFTYTSISSLFLRWLILGFGSSSSKNLNRNEFSSRSLLTRHPRKFRFTWSINYVPGLAFSSLQRWSKNDRLENVCNKVIIDMTF